MPTTVACVFAHNEAEALPITLTQLNRFKEKGLISHILVVNDGSTDSTVQVARKYGAMVITHAKNYGKRQAFISGATYAHKLGADVLLSLDADILHFPTRTLKKMIATVTTGKKAMAIASQHEFDFDPITQRDFELYGARKIAKHSTALGIQNIQSNAQRAISMKALAPLFQKNKKWLTYLSHRHLPLEVLRQYPAAERKLAEKWGLEAALNTLIPKENREFLSRPVYNQEAFRKQMHDKEKLKNAQMQGWGLIDLIQQTRSTTAQKLRAARKQKTSTH